MLRRIGPLVIIFICTSIAWQFLGATIANRMNASRKGLDGRVESVWGSPQVQSPPTASFMTNEKGIVELPLESSDIKAALDLDHRRKGLLWYSLYRVSFDARYGFRNTGDEARIVTFRVTLPAETAIYDDLVLALDGKPLAVMNHGKSIGGTAEIAAGAGATLTVAYRSQGLDTWRYSVGGQARNFALALKTNFRDIDFPDDSLAPTDKRESAGGWDLTWRFKSLFSGVDIAVACPQKLQPGPLAGEISHFAPVSLFFFFFLMFIITTLRGIDLHPMNYFFLATAFFAFHLLLAYLADHVPIHAAFAICSAVSIFLMVSYLRLVVGIRFAAVEAAAAQFVYLVLFSYAFFFQGFTGLSVAIGAIVTLFVVMQMTGRIRWAETFGERRKGPPPLPAEV